jgi:coproporphyrinogen III oxidase
LSGPDRQALFATFFESLQDRICAALEAFEPAVRFHEDVWLRPGGGGGRTRIIQNAQVLEKAGVNFARVHGELDAEVAAQLPGEGAAFSATGLSVVIHPRNPMVPSVHGNWRYLCRGNADWFGGGSDLTPYYPYRDDVIHFHRVWRDVCVQHAAAADYARFKRWCDEYFWLPHRNEARGVGGIFFDYLTGNWEATAAFVRDCAGAFIAAYCPLVERRRDEPYGEREKRFQEYRRSRYVEFNLLYDRGTAFGLKTRGRIESVLMSLPPVARWSYDYVAEAGSRESKLDEFLAPRDWANESP